MILKETIVDNIVKILIAIFIVGFLFGAAFCQPVDTVINTGFPKGVVKEQIIISATRSDENTSTQTNFSKEQISVVDYGQEASYILRMTPSVTSYSDAGSLYGYSYFRIRGLDQTKINVMLNGMPLNEPEDNGVYLNNIVDFANNANSIQIQRGIGTSTIGASNFVGSINFESAQVFAKSNAVVSLMGGSFNTYKASAEVTQELSNNVGVYARFSKAGSDGYRDNAFSNSYSFFGSIGYYDNSNILKVNAIIGNAKNGMAYLAVSEEDLDKDLKTNYLSPDEKDDFTQNIVQAQYVKIFSPKATLLSSAYFNSIQGNYGVNTGTNINNYGLNSSWIGINETFQYKEPESYKFDVGVSGSYYEREHTSAIQPYLSSNLYSNKGIKNELSGFIRFNHSIADDIALTEDVQIRSARFTYLPDNNAGVSKMENNWTFFNPKVTATYTASNVSSFYLSVGQNHREPTRSDMLQGYDNVDSTNASDIQTLSAIKPEEVVCGEFGYNYRTEAIQLATNIFYMNFNNEIAPIGTLSYIGLPLRKNIDGSQRYGIEADFTYNISNNFSLQTTGTYMKSNITSYTTEFDGKTYSNVNPLLSPELILNQFVNFYVGKLQATLSLRYVTRSYLDNTSNDEFVLPWFYDTGLDVIYQLTDNISTALHLNCLSNSINYVGGYVYDNKSYYYVDCPLSAYFEVKLKM